MSGRAPGTLAFEGPSGACRIVRSPVAQEDSFMRFYVAILTATLGLSMSACGKKAADPKPADPVAKPEEKPTDPVAKPEEKPTEPVAKPEEKPADPVAKPEEKPADPVAKPEEKP